jgi:hypothetical protein
MNFCSIHWRAEITRSWRNCIQSGTFPLEAYAAHYYRLIFQESWKVGILWVLSMLGLYTCSKIKPIQNSSIHGTEEAQDLYSLDIQYFIVSCVQSRGDQGVGEELGPSTLASPASVRKALLHLFYILTCHVCFQLYKMSFVFFPPSVG